MSKFKVGDLITDKKILVLIIEVNETYYTIKHITGSHQGEISDTSRDYADDICVKYDLDNSLTSTVNNGKCYCNECSDVLHYGDECIRYDEDIYCCENCLMSYIYKCSKYSIIGKNDLDNSSTTEKPLFELSEEQIKEIKKGVK